MTTLILVHHHNCLPTYVMFIGDNCHTVLFYWPGSTVLLATFKTFCARIQLHAGCDKRVKTEESDSATVSGRHYDRWWRRGVLIWNGGPEEAHAVGRHGRYYL